MAVLRISLPPGGTGHLCATYMDDTIPQVLRKKVTSVQGSSGCLVARPLPYFNLLMPRMEERASMPGALSWVRCSLPGSVGPRRPPDRRPGGPEGPEEMLHATNRQPA